MTATFSLPALTPAELAERLALPPAHAERLLEEWAAAGVVELVEPGRFRLSPGGAAIAQCLAAGRHDERVALTDADFAVLRDEIPDLVLPEPPRTTCGACGAELAQSVVQRKGRYCSRRCQQNSWLRKRRREAREARAQAAAAREDARRAEEREPSDAELEDEAGWEAPLPARKVAGVPFPSPIGSVPRSGDSDPSQPPSPKRS